MALASWQRLQAGFRRPIHLAISETTSFRRQTRRARTKKSPWDTTNAAPADDMALAYPHNAHGAPARCIAGCQAASLLDRSPPPPRPVFRIFKSRARGSPIPAARCPAALLCRARRHGMAAHTPDPARVLGCWSVGRALASFSNIAHICSLLYLDRSGFTMPIFLLAKQAS
jgi:hypothetical protein